MVDRPATDKTGEEPPNERGQLFLWRTDPDGAPLLRDGPYQDVLFTLERWRDWPEAQMAMIGDAAAGKSRLARYWAALSGAGVISGEDLGKASIDEISELTFSALAIDDAHLCESGDALLAAMNLCRERRAPLLLTGIGHARQWAQSPPDLLSRLVSIPEVHIGSPDEVTFKARLHAACRLRYMKLDDETDDYLFKRAPLTFAAIEDLARFLADGPQGLMLTKHKARIALEKLSQESSSEAR